MAGDQGVRKLVPNRHAMPRHTPPNVHRMPPCPTFHQEEEARQEQREAVRAAREQEEARRAKLTDEEYEAERAEALQKMEASCATYAAAAKDFAAFDVVRLKPYGDQDTKYHHDIQDHPLHGKRIGDLVMPAREGGDTYSSSFVEPNYFHETSLVYMLAFNRSRKDGNATLKVTHVDPVTGLLQVDPGPWDRGQVWGLPATIFKKALPTDAKPDDAYTTIEGKPLELHRHCRECDIKIDEYVKYHTEDPGEPYCAYGRRPSSGSYLCCVCMMKWKKWKKSEFKVWGCQDCHERKAQDKGCAMC